MTQSIEEQFTFYEPSNEFYQAVEDISARRDKPKPLEFINLSGTGWYTKSPFNEEVLIGLGKKIESSSMTPYISLKNQRDEISRGIQYTHPSDWERQVLTDLCRSEWRNYPKIPDLPQFPGWMNGATVHKSTTGEVLNPGPPESGHIDYFTYLIDASGHVRGRGWTFSFWYLGPVLDMSYTELIDFWESFGNVQRTYIPPKNWFERWLWGPQGKPARF